MIFPAFFGDTKEQTKGTRKSRDAGNWDKNHPVRIS
jgi:hypothetical protein